MIFQQASMALLLLIAWDEFYTSVSRQAALDELERRDASQNRQ